MQNNPLEGQGQWRAQQYTGYHTKAIYIIAYWRPFLKDIRSQH